MAVAFHPTTANIVTLLLPLLAWRMYRRFKRLVGRQRTSKYRPWISIGIYTLLLALLTRLLWGQWPALEALAGGLAAGGLLSRWAWRKTRLEPTPQGLYYTPHTYLGIALSLLFVARIAYRVVEVLWLIPPSEATMHHFVVSPLTMAVFGLMAGHTVGYALALFAWRQRVLAAKAARQARQERNPVVE